MFFLVSQSDKVFIMKQSLAPAIWLIIIMVGLPQLCETVYSPSLPTIARDLVVSENLIEHTLTIYLFAFALGILFWGIISDKFGRKPCVVAGLFIFIIGCLGCYLSTSITSLMISRFIQAFGGSIGSVLTQAICRDVFQGAQLSKVYSIIAMSLGFFPAIGPIIGAIIATNFGWPNIFLFLTIISLMLLIAVFMKLPETHLERGQNKVSIIEVLLRLAKDKNVFVYGYIVAGYNGIAFSYYAEGPFYFIDLLGFPVKYYGFSFMGISAFSFFGGLTSRHLQNKFHGNTVMKIGLYISMAPLILFVLVISLNSFYKIDNNFLIAIALMSQMILVFGFVLSTSNALSLALQKYKHCVGTASSLFGSFYYIVISLFTFGMGLLHNGTLIRMPVYFLCIVISMMLVAKLFLDKGEQHC